MAMNQCINCDAAIMKIRVVVLLIL